MALTTDTDRPTRTSFTSRPLVRLAVVLFVVLRVGTALLGAIAIDHGQPIEAVPDESRDMLGEPVLDDGPARYLLAPWQRFDTQRYLRIARDGYVVDRDSVFPPLYPWMIRAAAAPFGGGPTARLVAAILISDLAAVAAMVMLGQLVAKRMGEAAARRTLFALVSWPTAFFLVAAYTESLYLLFVLATFWQLEDRHIGRAGTMAGLAALTRLTGGVLVVPLGWWLWQHRAERTVREQAIGVAAASLPVVAVAGFVAYRSALGLPSMSSVYETWWHQTTSFPGWDLLRGTWWVFRGATPEGSVAFLLSVLAAWVLIAACLWGWRRLPRTWVLYSIALTAVLLLPTSDVRPMASVSRYVLGVFPALIMLGSIRPARLARVLAAMSVLLGAALVMTFASWRWVA